MDAARCEALAGRGAAGDAEACRALVEHLWPVWIELVSRSRAMGPLARSEDHVHNVVTRLVAKVAGQERRELGLYPAWIESHPGKTFEDWMRIVTANVVRDYVREQLGPRSSPPDEPSPKRLLNELALSPLADELGIRPSFTAYQTARQLLEFARSRLPAEQIEALELWLEGATFDDVEEGLGIAEGEGRKLVRAALAVLRRHFAGGGADLA